MLDKFLDEFKGKKFVYKSKHGGSVEGVIKSAMIINELEYSEIHGRVINSPSEIQIISTEDIPYKISELEVDHECLSYDSSSLIDRELKFKYNFYLSIYEETDDVRVKFWTDDEGCKKPLTYSEFCYFVGSDSDFGKSVDIFRQSD